MTHFIILTRSRTGSNLLVSLLDSHPQIQAQGELFARCPRAEFRSRMSLGFEPTTEGVTTTGFKIFYYHPTDGGGRWVWKTLMARKSIRVIHLKRMNKLRTIVSQAIALKTREWQIEAGSTKKATRKVVHLDPVRVEKAFKETEAWENRGDQQFADHPMLEVTYEDLVNSPDDTYAVVWTFLGVSDWSPTAGTLRQNPQPLRRLVTNYQALKQHFASTRWSVYFN